MKVSGFTIIKNAVHNGYPIVEAIRSILPLVTEMVVLVGDCLDNTREVIAGIGDEKIKIFDSVWNPALRKGGAVLADETNKAFRLIDPSSDWAFYIQGDEVVPEQSHAAITAAMQQYKNDQRVDGLVFRYLHFYGTFDYVGDSRRWYNREIRIIRNDPTITSYRDAQGFRRNGEKLPCKLIDAWVYHYGWVKSPEQMKKKMKDAAKYWMSDGEEWKAFMQSEEVFDFSDFDSLRKFTGQHPAVMQERIQRQHWQVELDIRKKKLSLKNRLLYFVEQLTGKRLFTFKNYTVVR